MKRFLHHGLDAPLYFWRDHTGNEIDLVLEYSDHLLPIEIKSGRTIAADSFKGLRYWLNLPKNSNKEGLLIYAGEKIYRREDIEIQPWNKIRVYIA